METQVPNCYISRVIVSLELLYLLLQIYNLVVDRVILNFYEDREGRPPDYVHVQHVVH